MWRKSAPHAEFLENYPHSACHICCTYQHTGLFLAELRVALWRYLPISFPSGKGLFKEFAVVNWVWLWTRTSPVWWWSALARDQPELMTRRTGMKAKKTSELLLQVCLLFMLNSWRLSRVPSLRQPSFSLSIHCMLTYNDSTSSVYYEFAEPYVDKEASLWHFYFYYFCFLLGGLLPFVLKAVFYQILWFVDGFPFFNATVMLPNF